MKRPIRLCGQQIEQPGHICAFFSSRDQEYETLIPYLLEGVEAGEEVFNVIDADRMEDHRTRLTAGGIPDGSVLVRSSEETYLDGGRFEMQRMADFIHDRLAEAAAAGKRVRTAGWMDWIHREAIGSNRAMEYEARMNLLVPTFDCTFMCVYDVAKLSGEMMVDIMATHPYVILKGQVRENRFYVPPDLYLKELLSPPDFRAPGNA